MVSTIQPFKTPITVARPALPPLEEFRQGLEEIWDRAWLTNDGPLVQKFRGLLMQFCGVDHASLFTNGTLSLQLAMQGMGITGDVITTPYTFVATTHALFSDRLRPVFVDIEPTYYSLDPDLIEAAITPWTSAILAVHLYGQPCRLKELQRIARKHGLKLLYDAAHAFGVEVDGQSIAHFGDLSMFSFHATKVFHSIEGGMLTFREPELQRRLDYLKNFGFENETEVVMPGTNAKMSEFQALMGILLLTHMEEMIEKRRKLTLLYRHRLAEIPGICLPALPAPGVRYNYAYMPIEVDEEAFGMSRDDLFQKLREYNVIVRRYFYPIIPDFPCYRHIFRDTDLSVARRVALRILVLPLYSELQMDVVERICDMVEYFHNRACSDAAAAVLDSGVSAPQLELVV
ncbi:MAG: DegT/DnrJ/EryC1/StrS family aminotransferase [Terracidiphilus sp.]|nr:DegT/DnrJ/EryC1/StrS family aminotransferase [Terracidiphilus sp.]